MFRFMTILLLPDTILAGRKKNSRFHIFPIQLGFLFLFEKSR